MTTSPSIRNLFRELTPVLDPASSWLLLNPGFAPFVSLWSATGSLPIPMSIFKCLGQAVANVPRGGQTVTTRALWARSLVDALLGPQSDSCEYGILPFFDESRLIGCLGWLRPQPSRAAAERPYLPAIRRIFQTSYALAKASNETSALRWVLERSDRPVAVARPNGELLDTSLSGNDLLKTLQYGARHYFHADGPALPATAAKALGQTDAGEIKLSDNCTARFEPLQLSGHEWISTVGIEFFSKSAPSPVPPLTRLTPVERDIYERLRTTGMTNIEIAKARGTSSATIKNQVSVILEKMGVKRRSELIASYPPGAPFSVSDPSSGRNGGTFKIR